MNAEQLLRLVEDFGDVEAAKRLWGLAKRLGDEGLKQRAAVCLWERGAWRVEGGHESGPGAAGESCDQLAFSEGFGGGQRALLGVRHWGVVVDGGGGSAVGVVGAVVGVWMLRVGLLMEGERRGGARESLEKMLRLPKGWAEREPRHGVETFAEWRRGNGDVWEQSVRAVLAGVWAKWDGKKGFGERLNATFVGAHQVIQRLMLLNAMWQGMSAQVSGVWVLDREVVVGHLGMSWVWRERGGVRMAVTTPHSVGEHLRKVGAIPYPQQVPARYFGMMARGLGRGSEGGFGGGFGGFGVEISTFALEPGDCFLVCSAGLKEVLGEAAIWGVWGMLREGLSPQEVCSRLVEAAQGKKPRGSLACACIVLVES